MLRAPLRSLTGLAVLLTLVLPLSGCGLFGPSIPDPFEPIFIVVDRTESAYTVFTTAPRTLTFIELDALQNRMQERKNVDVVTWTRFSAAEHRVFSERVLRNDYPDSRVAEGLRELLSRYAGIPFGVTWNGGIAFTFQDYEYAKRTYELHMADPEGGERGYDARLEVDPVQPELHFGPLLGW